MADQEVDTLEKAIADAKLSAGTQEAPPAEAPPAEAAPQVQNDDGVIKQMEARYVAAQNELQTKLWEATQRAKDAERKAEDASKRSYKDPYKAFTELGGSFDELAEREINNGAPTTEHTVEELKKLVHEQIQWRKEREAQEQQASIAAQRQAAVNATAGDMLRELRSDTDAYNDVNTLVDFVSEMSGADPQAFLASKVAPIMEKFHQDTGRQLTPVELLGTLRQETEGFLDKLRNSKAIRSLYGLDSVQTPSDEQPAESLPADNRPVPAPAPTLTQTQAAAPDKLPEDIASMSNAKLYQLVDQLARK